MGLPTRITLPPSGRSVGGLLAASRPITGDWWRGVSFSSGQCIAPQSIGACTEGAVSKDPQHLSDPAVFDAFSVLVALECSTLGNTPLANFADASLDVTREFAVGRELLTGAASGNPSLADASVIANPAPDAETALACLEQIAADTLYGRLAFIHASPIIASALFVASAIWKDGTTWRTVSGNPVIVSPGYDGREPGGDAPDADDPLYLYVTGEVYAAVGQRDNLNATERGQNTNVSIAEDAAVVAFDPCFNVAMDAGLIFCDLSFTS